jgi:hypothetical protein
MINTAMTTVRPRVMACGRSYVHGTLRASVTVNPDGKVGSVVIEESPTGPYDDLGHCVSSKLEQLTFPPTRNGGTFRMPFVF